MGIIPLFLVCMHYNSVKNKIWEMETGYEKNTSKK